MRVIPVRYVMVRHLHLGNQKQLFQLREHNIPEVNMKTIKYILLLSVLLIFSGVANATPIPTTWTDTIDANQWISAGSDITFNLAVDTQVTPSPYTPGLGNDWIESATLDIDLWGLGTGRININNLQTQRYYVFFFNDVDVTLSCEVVNDLSSTGLLHVIFDRAYGIQWLDSMTLTANGYDNTPTTAPVPEPATLLMLGSGIMGLAFYGRRRMKR
jgi:hypothetical protein